MKERNAIAVLLLTLFVPFYMLYWFYQTAKTLRARGASPPRFLLLVGPLLAYLLFIVPFLLLRLASVNSPVINVISLLAGTVAVILMIVCPFIYFYKFSKASEQATSNKVSSTVAFIIFIFVGAVSCYLIQDALNTTESPTSPAATNPAVSSPFTPDPSTPVPTIASPTPPSTEQTITPDTTPSSEETPKTI